MRIKIDVSKGAIAIILLIMTIVSSNLNWGKTHWTNVIIADGKGYYAYLPAVFIYKDLNFGFFDEIEKEKYFNENKYYDYRASTKDGKIINKYYCGTALAEMPFFLLAHLGSFLTENEMDGYSKLYPIFINIGALCYLLLGLFFLNALLKLYQVSEGNRAITLIAAVFGTNLFYYVAVEPSMSHIYSFTFITLFFYYAKQYFITYSSKTFLILGILVGMIVLIRPINGLVFFALPFVAGKLSTFKIAFSKLFSQKKPLLLGLLFFLGIVSIQLLIYKISTGNFFVYSYQEEGFNFLSPHFIDILFSYKKGLFLYTPVYLVALSGGYFLWKSNRFEFYTWFGFFCLITYVFSSWWMWYYGGSFSSRVYVDILSLFMVLLGISFQQIMSKLFKRLFLGVIILLILACQIQTYQYRYYQIHWVDMTQEKYWDVFLRIDKLIK